MTDKGWSADPADVLRYRVVRALAESEGQAGQADVLARELNAQPQEVAAAFDRLIGDGYATPVDSGSAGTSYTEDGRLTSAGVQYAGEMKIAIASPRQQYRAATAAMLDWLADAPGERVTSTHDLHDDPRGSLFGEPFTPGVLTDVGRTLKEHELIKGTGTAQGPILRPSITTSGEMVSERFGGNLIAWQASAAAGAGAINISGSTSVNVAANSPWAHQSASTVTAEERRQQIITVADALEQMTPLLSLSPTDDVRAGEVVAGLREIAQTPGASDGRLGDLMQTVRGFGLSAASGAAGTALVALVETAGHTLGLG